MRSKRYQEQLLSRKEIRLTASPVLAAVVRRVLARLKPSPRLKVSEWADQFRQLSREGSAEPGRWRTSRAEYQRGIMDAVAFVGLGHKFQIWAPDRFSAQLSTATGKMRDLRQRLGAQGAAVRAGTKP